MRTRPAIFLSSLFAIANDDDSQSVAVTREKMSID